MTNCTITKVICSKCGFKKDNHCSIAGAPTCYDCFTSYVHRVSSDDETRKKVTMALMSMGAFD